MIRFFAETKLSVTEDNKLNMVFLDGRKRVAELECWPETAAMLCRAIADALDR